MAAHQRVARFPSSDGMSTAQGFGRTLSPSRRLIHPKLLKVVCSELNECYAPIYDSYCTLNLSDPRFIRPLPVLAFRHQPASLPVRLKYLVSLPVGGPRKSPAPQFLDQKNGKRR